LWSFVCAMSAAVETDVTCTTRDVDVPWYNAQTAPHVRRWAAANIWSTLSTAATAWRLLH